MKSYIFINGKYFEPCKAKIGVTDSGFQYGDGLFETMQGQNGRVLDVGEHLDRLFSSLRFFRYRPVFSKQDVHCWITETIKKNRLDKSDAYIKVIVSRGQLGKGLSFNDCLKINIVIIARKREPYPLEYYRKGVKIIRSSIIRTNVSNPCYRHKLINYFENIYARNEALSKNAAEAVFLTENNIVLEGASSSIFIVNGKEIITPPLSYNILPGITRKRVISICRENGISVKEGKFDYFGLKHSDGVFITNALMGVMPVVSADQTVISDGKPCHPAMLIADLYKTEVSRKQQAGLPGN